MKREESARMAMKEIKLAANFGMKPNGLVKLVEDKFRSCTTNHDRVVVKWLGWLMIFLVMNKEEKRLFIENDRNVEATINELTKDLYGLNRRKQNTNKVRTTEDYS